MIPPTLRRHVTSVWGEAGARWLATLPETLHGLAADWDLTVGEPFDLTYHYVTAVTTADGTPAVLKLGVPEADALTEESRALTAFAGRGAVHLQRSDLTRGALLIERAVPGVRARDVPDAEATAAVAAVMRELHRPGDALPDVALQAGAFDRYLARFPVSGPLPTELVVTAAGLMRELCASAPATVLLHGDLHHDNLLSAARAPWLAIDPHGASGDPGYEIGSWLFNPEPDDRDPALLALVPGRLEQLADLIGQPLERLVAWGFVKAVLSDVWSAENWSPGDTWSPASRALDVARLLWPQVSRSA
ncbi:aminoglycoside phosphotransferase family protein [Dactylosporangium matsuzakiense]|uniref:Hydroxyurea phosphotransferase n=1 Tax=Dactylosporangium matsuzakiense TaxID=53360 RepID=A0A9W6NPM8_9ACTN|nr:hydroxyurea phosphotransferase [Dactylosporangium matsuzakiense]